MIAIPFNQTDGTGIDLNGTAITIENHSRTGDYGEQGTDLIQVWKPSMSNYDDFYFYADYDEDGKWCSADGNDQIFNEVEGYENGFPAGSSAWYYANKDCDRAGDLKITVSGAVATEYDATYTLDGGNYNMIANPFPIGVDLNNSSQIVITNHSKTGDYGEEGTDLIQVWKSSMSNYDDFYFYADYDEDGKWCSADGNDQIFNECEGYENGLAKSFWYYANKDCDREGTLTIKFINPIK